MQHEADVNVTDDGGRKKAGLRRITKCPFNPVLGSLVMVIIMHHDTTVLALLGVT
jgi:hypothetical protein